MTTPQLLRRAVMALLVLLGLAVGALYWFAAWHYPAAGLSGIGQDQYDQAMGTVTRGLVLSRELTFNGFDFVKYRRIGQSYDMLYVWGVARCRSKAGATVLYWVSLEWNAKRNQWQRSEILELGAPGDEIYFTRRQPGQIARVKLALGKILDQLSNHIREAKLCAQPAADLPTPGL